MRLGLGLGLASRKRHRLPASPNSVKVACTEWHCRGWASCCIHTRWPLQKREAASGAITRPYGPWMSLPSSPAARTWLGLGLGLGLGPGLGLGLGLELELELARRRAPGRSRGS